MELTFPSETHFPAIFAIVPSLGSQVLPACFSSQIPRPKKESFDMRKKVLTQVKVLTWRKKIYNIAKYRTNCHEIRVVMTLEGHRNMESVDTEN